ncbi:3606_t:CDS:2 [Funneliformis geosporum]|uniref:15663_t:CDS:1 n=1 Tax=Funneliformis geosporum TaxID=1117311 RepID=A0A9W4WRJ0_9GLOM|nr:3606_t:CDS:2 [Funneliformis geosporum]CAI2173547.1 15663_t:CDS:2 [Funneliformis geosporum]
MTKYNTTLLLFFVITAVVSCFSKVNAAAISTDLQARSIQRPQNGTTTPEKPTEENSPKAFYYNQTIDHLNKTSGKFFQKYYVNSTFYKESGPILLYTPGESTIEPSITTFSFISELAANLSGLLINIEHRYYGESDPSKDFKYLTIDQALLDFANFIQNPPEDLKIPKDAKWITVGASYAGNLATWMRKKFPKDVFAAYASSAPIEARLDFFEYDQRVSKALPCAKNISDAFSLVFDPILTSGNESAILELKQTFGLEMLEDNRDFASALSFPTSTIVQDYVPPQSPEQLDNILAICGPFAQAPESPETSALIYTEGVKAFLNITGITTPETKINTFATTSINTKENKDLTSYTYQYCTELGYYQTAPKFPLLSIRSKTIDISYYQGQCDFIFPGIVSSPMVNITNKKFGGFNGKFSKTVFVNGDMDPWTALSVSSDSVNPKTTKENSIFLIKGGSHGTEFSPPSPFDSDSLKESRIFVRDTLAKWLIE